MPGLSVNDLNAQVDHLISEHAALRARSKYDDLSDLGDEYYAYAVRLRAAIERLAPGMNPYTTEMQTIISHGLNYSTSDRIVRFLGILRALKGDANNGWLEGVAELLHADTFSDFLEQADELLDKGYKDAAAVVAGSTLEAHIRLLCTKHGVTIQLSSGQFMNADRMNAELVKVHAYSSLQQKGITGWQAIRNSAAHGDYLKYDASNVSNMISSIRNFILQYPA